MNGDRVSFDWCSYMGLPTEGEFLDVGFTCIVKSVFWIGVL